ncbi:MAG: S-methyl-5-thioribose-1-phosphate isomerase, partial [Methylocella sp.]
MKVNGRHYRTIWLNADGRSVDVIDQSKLPHAFETQTLGSFEDAVAAIKNMVVRGAPLIGVTGAYGLALAAAADPADNAIETAYAELLGARPTAVNLRWALDRLRDRLFSTPPSMRRPVGYSEAAAIADEDIRSCHAIGEYGAALISAAASRCPGRPVNILTHCNAGWLAAVDWGTALAPVYKAARAGVGVHVWVDETRP